MSWYPSFLLSDFINEHKDRSTKIGILGLAFKPNSDDIRETPALQCIKILQNEGYHDIIVYDPMAMTNFAQTYPKLGIAYSENVNELLSKSEVVLILTAWSEFAELDYTNKNVYNFIYIPLKHKMD